MDHHDRSSSLFIQNEEQGEQLYCSLALQNSDDIIWDGSDAEQTVEEIEKKRFRYEVQARRYLCGHRPVLQSASLRGPLHRQAGWANPWRYRPQKEPEWGHSGTEVILGVGENLMKRAEDHGLGYFDPSEALAWCKAAAGAEGNTRRETEPCDSMEAIKSEDELDGDNWNENLPMYSVPEEQPYSTTSERGLYPHPNCSQVPGGQYSMGRTQRNDPAKTNSSTNNGTRGIKRSADAPWLKGSFISKRARCDTPIVSSPTPIPGFAVERSRHRRQNSARLVPGSGKGRVDLISHPTTGWSHDAYRREAGSRSTGSIIRAAGLNESRGNVGQGMTGSDELHKDPQEATFGIMGKFSSRTVAKGTGIISADRSPSNLEPSDLETPHTLIKANVTTPAPIDHNSCAQRSGSSTSRLPRLPRNWSTQDDIGSVEDYRFVTEVMPSSKNLEKFQFRKKRRNANNLQPGQPYRGSHDQAGNAFRSSLKSTSSEVDEKPPGPTVSAAEDVVNALSLHGLASEVNEEPPSLTTPIEMQAFDVDPARVQNKMSKIDLSDDIWERMEGFEHSPSERGGNRPLDLAAAASHVLPRIQDPISNSPTAGAEPSPIKFSERSLPSAKHVKPISLNSGVLPRRDGQCNRVSAASEDIHQSQPTLPGLTRKSQEMPMLMQNIDDPKEEPTPDDNSTQSGSLIPVEPSRSPCGIYLSPEEAPDSPVHVETTIAIEERELPDELLQDEINFERNTHVLRDDIEDGIKVTTSSLMKNGGSSDDNVQDEMEIIPKAPGFRAVGSRNITEIDQDHSSQQLLSSNDTELGRTTTLGTEDDGNQTPQDHEQESWQGCGPQSPWMEENLQALPSFISGTHNEEEALMSRGRSPIQARSEEDWDTQHLERPKLPENDGIRPFKDFMTPTPSPEPVGVYTNQDGLSDNQLMVEAAIINPWTRNAKSPESAKKMKRVSFGMLPSEDNQNSDQESSTLCEPVSGSPPPPQAVERLCDDDAFDDRNLLLSKFRKHFAAAARFKRLLPNEDSSFLKSSPAIGAMAEAFIAADRDTSSEHERRATIDNTPSRYLKAKSDASNNASPQDRAGDSLCISPNGKLAAVTTRALDCDLDVNVYDFLSDGGGVLEDWSVEAEVKKVNESTGKTESRSNSEKRRSLFGITSGWS